MRTQTHTDAVVETLSHLIQTNRDSESGYWTAAEGVKDPALHTLFHRYCQQRARFAAELEQEIRIHGGERPEGGTIAGKVRGSWQTLKAAIGGGKQSVVLGSAEDAELGALEDYEDALQAELPEYIKETLRQQHDEIQESLQHVRALKEASNNK